MFIHKERIKKIIFMIMTILVLNKSQILYASDNDTNESSEAREEESGAQSKTPNAHSKAVMSAEDGFGSQLSDEQIGLYNSGFARGFSPEESGNILLEGMFYRKSATAGGFFLGSRTYVGISAQSFPFAAPSGVVDYELTKGVRAAVADIDLSINRDNSTMIILSAILRAPVIKDRLNFAAGATAKTEMWRGEKNHAEYTRSLFLTPHWDVSSNLGITAYWSHVETRNPIITPYYYIPNGDLPDISRTSYTSPKWIKGGQNGNSYGALIKYISDDWTIKAHLFFSRITFENMASEGIEIINAKKAKQIITWIGPYKSNEPGGEIRISRAYTIGQWKALSLISVHGFDQRIRQSFSIRYSDKNYILGAASKIAAPNYEWRDEDFFTIRSGSKSYGLSQSFFYKDIIETNFSLRRMQSLYEYRDHYKRNHGENYATLPTASIVVKAGHNLHFYTSLSRGLLNSTTAPGYAANASQLLPANKTKQWDVGGRWKFASNSSLIISYFDIMRPYNGLDDDENYGELGNYGNRGIEISYSQWIGDNLYLLSAAMLAPARIRNITDDSYYEISSRPSGISDNRATLYLYYQVPKVKGLSLWSSADYASGKTTDGEGISWQKGEVDMSFGITYDILYKRSLLSARLSFDNLIQQHRWYAAGDDYYYPSSPRSISLTLASTF